MEVQLEPPLVEYSREIGVELMLASVIWLVDQVIALVVSEPFHTALAAGVMIGSAVTLGLVVSMITCKVLEAPE